MKKVGKIIGLFLIFMIVSLWKPLSVDAKSFLEYQDINVSATGLVDSIKFSNIIYHKNSTSFGLRGTLINKDSISTKLYITVFYYNYANEMVAADSTFFTLKPDEIMTYEQVADFNIIKEKYNVDDIKYYSLKLSVLDTAASDMLGDNDGYSNYWLLFCYSLPVLFLIISLWWYWKDRKDKSSAEIPRRYPPEGLNSLQIGYLYKGKADSQDVISLLIYLANLGYLKISEIEKDTGVKKRLSFKIIKGREYDGTNVEEKLFIDGLFPFRSTEVTETELFNEFYVVIDEILKGINTKENRNKIYERRSVYKKFSIWTMIVISFYLITIPPIMVNSSWDNMIIFMVFLSLGFFITLFGVVGRLSTPVYEGEKLTYRPRFMRNGCIILGLFIGGIPWIGFVLPGLLVSNIYLGGYIIGTICLICMIVITKYFPKRTVYGHDFLKKIQEFKFFIETCNKDQFDLALLHNPSYFFEILPYVYVLDVTDKWKTLFDMNTFLQPDWYVGNKQFFCQEFSTFLLDMLTTANSSMSSIPTIQTYEWF